MWIVAGVVVVDASGRRVLAETEIHAFFESLWPILPVPAASLSAALFVGRRAVARAEVAVVLGTLEERHSGMLRIPGRVGRRYVLHPIESRLLHEHEG